MPANLATRLLSVVNQLEHLGHIWQIAELLRAYRYYPHLGAFRRYYSVAP